MIFENKDKDFSEKVLTRLHEIKNEFGIDLVEATTRFCVEQDIDPIDLIKKLKPSDIAQIKQDAINGSYVRKSVATKNPELPL